MVTIRQITNTREIRDDAVHREHAVGRDQLEGRASFVGLLQARFEIGEIVVLVAQAHAIDNAPMVQLVADDCVFFSQQGFEQPAVRVKTARGSVAGRHPRVTAVAQAGAARLYAHNVFGRWSDDFASLQYRRANRDAFP